MKLLKSFCGAVFIMMFFVVINATATPPGTDSWSSTNNDAEFNADLYCVPTFTVSGEGGLADGEFNYTQVLGNYFVGYIGEVDTKDIVFTLRGPGKYYDNTAIHYGVKVLNSFTTTTHGASILAKWSIHSGNWNITYDGAGQSWNFSGQGGWIELIPESDNCQSYATFTITSISIDLATNWVTTTSLPATETFSFILEASVDI
jgi:hypothetical protein